MALPNLLSPVDTPEARSAWSFAHARHHDAIDAALLTLNVNSPQVPLDPMPPLDTAGPWLLDHQEKHTAMNAVLGLTGEDLTKFDLTTPDGLLDFADGNFEEHTGVVEELSRRRVQVEQ